MAVRTCYETIVSPSPLPSAIKGEAVSKGAI
jgi:hypothetical protein